MPDSAYDTTAPLEGARAAERSTARILGQVMFLVAVAIGFMVAGTLMGRELTEGAARACFFAGMGMLVATWFVDRLRHGSLGIGWLCGFAVLFGMGLGPALNYLAETDPGAITTAVGITALTVLGMAAIGFVLEKDTAGWMRPLSFVVLGAVVISLGALVFGGLGALSPAISLVILVASALLILVDFNYIRKHATEADVVWLATGIFVSIVNIFISLLNLTSD
ncbi:MAG TPA: Bax inhibitor-1 family protein [Solirubrobacteraceae bacterium]|jgi:modulator of FtsH protease|nr:Bax inhibitor-1 family protein [Solirubrobacteraceae bacterium]